MFYSRPPGNDAQAMTKRVPDRHWAVVQAFAFLREYGGLRGCAQVIEDVVFVFTVQYRFRMSCGTPIAGPRLAARVRRAVRLRPGKMQ